MLARCRYEYFAHWAGRGIVVCDRWLQFENFKLDMGERPLGYTLDRINNDGNYEPGNCRWATQKEQNLNKRSNARQKLTKTDIPIIRDDTRTHEAIARDYGVSRPTITQIKNRRYWAHIG